MPDFSRSNLQINEIASHDYVVRARMNAQAGDVTIALSMDFGTRREKIIRECAGRSYICARLMSDSLKTARSLLRKLRTDKAKTLNVTGDTLATLANHNLTQEQANEYVYRILSSVHQVHPIQRILSSGSTGVDLAATLSGMVLGIETVVTAPNDLKLVMLGRIQYGATQLWESLQDNHCPPHKLI